MKADEIFKNIEENKKDVEFLPTGFSCIDRDIDGGLLKKEITLLGAFTGIGKSIIAGQIFFNIASKGFKSAYFSLEISCAMILSRLVGQKSNIKPARILNGLLEVHEFDKKAKAKAEIIAHNEFMDFYDGFYLFEEIKKTITENHYEFVVIDFIQNILLNNNMDEYQRLSFVAVSLQKLAKETNCSFLVLSQLSNSASKSGTNVVEYKGSGAIAQIADLGFFVERAQPILDINNQPIGNQPVRINLRKNRRGISGLSWELEFIHPGGMIIEKT